jgi:hypothetical protein
LRAAFVAWPTVLRKILTMDNLRKRHVIVIDRCSMYKRNGGFVDHLLLHCEIASAIWNVLFSRFGLSWVISKCIVDLYGLLGTADST